MCALDGVTAGTVLWLQMRLQQQSMNWPLPCCLTANTVLFANPQHTLLQLHRHKAPGSSSKQNWKLHGSLTSQVEQETVQDR